VSVALEGQQESDDRACWVVGDGMCGRSCNENQGDLSGTRREFTAPDKGTKTPLGRSQSTRRREEAG
jgi:hypothetical protein